MSVLAGTDVSNSVTADLIAVLVAATEGAPLVMTIRDGDALPSGPFELTHRSLQTGLRVWVEEQTRHPLGYVEQLYTFADRDRIGAEVAHRTISISYLALTREERRNGAREPGWRNWYDYFPWEDHRRGAPALIVDAFAPRLRDWADAASGAAERNERRQRVAITFGLEGATWNEELVLQRYELLYETAMIAEGRQRRPRDISSAIQGREMTADHRRILATGIARLRAKIKYRPVVFELMQPTFTLLQLQRTVEALAGRLVHKQNFRRLIEQQELVEETGASTADTGGRPAKLFRFRHAVLAERAAVGTKLPLTRA